MTTSPDATTKPEGSPEQALLASLSSINSGKQPRVAAHLMGSYVRRHGTSALRDRGFVESLLSKYPLPLWNKNMLLHVVGNMTDKTVLAVISEHPSFRDAVAHPDTQRKLMEAVFHSVVVTRVEVAWFWLLPFMTPRLAKTFLRSRDVMMEVLRGPVSPDFVLSLLRLMQAMEDSNKYYNCILTAISFGNLTIAKTLCDRVKDKDAMRRGLEAAEKRKPLDKFLLQHLPRNMFRPVSSREFVVLVVKTFLFCLDVGLNIRATLFAWFTGTLRSGRRAMMSKAMQQRMAHLLRALLESPRIRGEISLNATLQTLLCQNRESSKSATQLLPGSLGLYYHFGLALLVADADRAAELRVFVSLMPQGAAIKLLADLKRRFAMFIDITTLMRPVYMLALNVVRSVEATVVSADKPAATETLRSLDSEVKDILTLVRDMDASDVGDADMGCLILDSAGVEDSRELPVSRQEAVGAGDCCEGSTAQPEEGADNSQGDGSGVGGDEQEDELEALTEGGLTEEAGS